MFRRSRRSYGNTTRTIANDPDDWDDRDRLDRTEFYPDDWDDRVKFKAIIWKHSQTIGTIEGYPRNHHSYPMIHILLLMCSKMAASTTELNTSLFMEEVQKYPSIYNKFCKDYKNKFIRMNCWKAIGEKLGLDAAEAEKNTRMFAPRMADI